MSSVKSMLKNWLPPVILKALRNRRGGVNRFEGDFPSWEAASAQCTGYDAENILAKVLEATLKVKRGEAAFERDSVVFDEMEYSWPVTAGLMWAAARSGGRLNVLDFGGSLGSTYFQIRKLLESLPEVRWSVVEQAHYVDAGRVHIQDTRLRFYRTIEECLAENQPNVVLLSGVLQFLHPSNSVLTELLTVGASCLIIDRTPFIPSGRDRILVQRVPASIYSASYPMWVLSKQKLLDELSKDWSLIASHLCPEAFVQTKEGFEFSFEGLVLESRR